MVLLRLWLFWHSGIATVRAAENLEGFRSLSSRSLSSSLNPAGLGPSIFRSRPVPRGVWESFTGLTVEGCGDQGLKQQEWMSSCQLHFRAQNSGS